MEHGPLVVPGVYARVHTGVFVVHIVLARKRFMVGAVVLLWIDHL